MIVTVLAQHISMNEKRYTAQAFPLGITRTGMMLLLCSIASLSNAETFQREDGMFVSKPPAKNENAGNTANSSLTNLANKPVTAKKDSGSIKGSLNFVDADIESVIAAVGDYTNITFIIDPRVKGTVTLVSEKPLTKSQAFQLLTSVLRMRGYSVVSANGYKKVVPEADAKLQPGPIQAGNKASGLRGDQIATQIFQLNFESANNLVAILRPLISPNNTISANPDSNTLIVTDYADNLLRLAKIIASLDRKADNDMEVIPIKNAIASDIAAIVNQLLETKTAPAQGAASGARVHLLTDPRSNSVILRAQSEAQAELARSLIEKFDIPTAIPGNVHVVYLKNAEATKLAQTLRSVVSSDVSIASTASSAKTASPTSPAASAQAPASLPSGGPAGFIQADATTNTLIITANDAVYRNLRAIIDQLDARRAQVYIESMIVEVSATKAAELGVQWAGVSGNANSTARVAGVTAFNSGGNNIVNQATASSPLPPGNGLTLGILRNSNLGALAHALATDTSANILSMPNLITLDNEEAKIIVGQNVPFITGQYTTSASAGGAAGVNPFQTVERKDIGLTLRVKPQISQGGTVKMSIYQETSGIDNTVNTVGAGLATTKRSLDTNVLVDDGQTIVLGGLIDDNLQESVEKVPLLGDIPLLGSLFQYKTRSHVKRNLMVFLRPTIIRNNEQSSNLAADRYDYIRNEEKAAKPEHSIVMPNMEAPLLPEMQNGQITGGHLSQPPKQNSPSSPSETSTTQTPANKEGEATEAIQNNPSE